MEGRIAQEMKPTEAAKCRPEYEAMDKKVFASRLKGMRKVVAKPQKVQKEEAWSSNNPARIQMKWDVADGVITSDMDIATAKSKRALYQNISDDLFKSRLNGMKEIVKKGLERAAEDKEALMEDRMLHPRPKTNHRGEPEWNESRAKELLLEDMDERVHLKLTPEELWESRPEYKLFYLETFRGHIHQEIHTRKWRDQWVHNKKDYTIVPEPHYNWREQLLVAVS